jgi:hypothetical protein
MFARCAWTSGFNHELELDEFAGTPLRSPFIVGDSCPERTATGRLTGPGPAAGASRLHATASTGRATADLRRPRACHRATGRLVTATTTSTRREGGAAAGPPKQQLRLHGRFRRDAATAHVSTTATETSSSHRGVSQRRGRPASLSARYFAGLRQLVRLPDSQRARRVCGAAGREAPFRRKRARNQRPRERPLLAPTN